MLRKTTCRFYLLRAVPRPWDAESISIYYKTWCRPLQCHPFHSTIPRKRPCSRLSFLLCHRVGRFNPHLPPTRSPQAPEFSVVTLTSLALACTSARLLWERSEIMSRHRSDEMNSKICSTSNGLTEDDIDVASNPFRTSYPGIQSESDHTYLYITRTHTPNEQIHILRNMIRA